MIHSTSRRVQALSVLLSGALFGVAVVTVTYCFREEPVLMASANQARVDMDGDGLTDAQEYVLRTLPDRADTDNDGYSDLEELARQSDPRLAASVPSMADVSLGMCASSDGSTVRVLSAAWVNGGDLQRVRMRIGVVHRGRGYSMSPAGLRSASGYQYGARNAGDSIGVVEFLFPQSLLARFGQLNFYSVGVRSGDTEASVAAVLTLVDMGGVATVVESYEFSSSPGNATPGVVYRPLGGNGSAPLNWTAGEVCFQRTATVGTDGAMLIQEIEAAECISMDSFCSGSGCSAGVGTTLQVPNPAALAGG